MIEEDNSFESYMKKAQETEKCFYNKSEMLNGDPNNSGLPFPDWLMKVADHIGERIRTQVTGEEFTLIGVSSTWEDYYYILKKDNGGIEFDTCVDGIEFI